MLSDYSLDLNSETMISFLEMENVQEVETVEKKQVFKEQVTRPSVIMKPMKEVKKEAKVPNLADILTSCGIEYDLVDSPEHSPVQSPSSIHSDMELEKTQELIDELEEFFMKTDGTPTVVDEEVTDTNITMEELNNAVTTNMMTEDKNTNLREQLSEMETEFKYLKKLMMEAGLGSYAAAVKY